VLVDGVEGLRAAAILVDAEWAGAGRLVVAPGGHLLIDPAPTVSPTIKRVEVSIGFRTWPLDEPQLRALSPEWRRRAAALANRVKSRLR
jgi:hypothetical protein